MTYSVTDVIKKNCKTFILKVKVISVVGKQDMQSRLDSAMQDVNDKYLLMEEQEKRALRKALIEERGRFCLFVSCLKPFVVSINLHLVKAEPSMIVLDCCLHYIL